MPLPEGNGPSCVLRAGLAAFRFPADQLRVLTVRLVRAKMRPDAVQNSPYSCLSGGYGGSGGVQKNAIN